MDIDNWRWKGVPFILRSGKALGTKRKEAVVTFRPVPHLPEGFTGVDSPNQLRIGFGPDTLQFDVDVNGPGDIFSLDRVTLKAELSASDLLPYGEVLEGVLTGDPLLSVRGRHRGGLLADRRAGAEGLGARDGPAGGVRRRAARSRRLAGVRSRRVSPTGTQTGREPGSQPALVPALVAVRWAGRLAARWLPRRVRPVRTRTASNTSTVQTLPSPARPVLELAMMTSRMSSACSSVASTSTRILGSRSTLYSAPR